MDIFNSLENRWFSYIDMKDTEESDGFATQSLVGTDVEKEEFQNVCNQSTFLPSPAYTEQESIACDSSLPIVKSTFDLANFSSLGEPIFSSSDEQTLMSPIDELAYYIPLSLFHDTAQEPNENQHIVDTSILTESETVSEPPMLNTDNQLTETDTLPMLASPLTSSSSTSPLPESWPLESDDSTTFAPQKKSPRRISTSVRSMRFSCKLCDKVFNRQHNLKVHMETHEADRVKPFECNACSKTFPRKACLQRHEATHKNLDCSLCSAVFNGRILYKRHLRLEHGMSKELVTRFIKS